MPKTETRLITRSKEEDRRIREAVAQETAERVLSTIREHFEPLSAELALLKGIVSRSDLANLYDKDEQTIARWAKRHGFKKVDGPDRRKIYYDIEDVKNKVRSAKGFEDSQTVSKRPDKRRGET